MERRVAVRAIIIHEGKFLAVKLKSYTGALPGDYWCTIGGTVETGEALIPALTREVVEETGITPVIGNLLYIQQFTGGGKEHLEFFFHVTNSEDFLHVDLNNTTHGAEEISAIEFIIPAGKNLLPIFLMTEQYTDLTNQPTKFFSSL